MSQSPENADPKITFAQKDDPPLRFGARRVFYQYTIAIPQTHLVLVSILQGIVLGLLLQALPFAKNPTLFFSNHTFFQEYFYLSYIITGLVILIVWMDVVYASAVFIWPPTAFQAALIFALAVAEVVMVAGIENVPIWVAGCGLITIIGGVTRCNNFRLFQKEDFEEHELGRTILRNELIYGLIFIVLGLIGVLFGWIFPVILTLVTKYFYQWDAGKPEVLLRWVSYVSILLDIMCILTFDVRYRQWLLRQLTKDTDLHVTRHGGIRIKSLQGQENASLVGRIKDAFSRKKTTQQTITAVQNKTEREILGAMETLSAASTGGNVTSTKAVEASTHDEAGHVDINETEKGTVELSASSHKVENFADKLDIDAAVTFDRERLYRLWEKGNWSTQAIDLTRDGIDWREKLSEEQRVAIRFIVAMFLNGEVIVTANLAPFIEAASHHEDRVFLSTQIADEARHHVFFNRFLHEVTGAESDMASTLGTFRTHLSASYYQLFNELDHITSRLRRRPNDALLLAQGLMLYHFILEGIAQAGQHFLLEFGKETGLLPGFIQGVSFIARDESRHIAFGVQWLRELVNSSPACKASAIHTLNRVLPWGIGIFFPDEFDLTFLDSLCVSTREMCVFILRVLERRLGVIGISPGDIAGLVKLGYPDSPETQTERIFTLLGSGVIGASETPHMTEEAMDVIFTAIRNIAAWTQMKQHGANARIQWVFNELSPRYLEIGCEEGACTGVGYIDKPDLTLLVSAADWARIATGRLKPQQAVIKRRLLVSGKWRLALRLQHILALGRF